MKSKNKIDKIREFLDNVRCGLGLGLLVYLVVNIFCFYMFGFKLPDQIGYSIALFGTAVGYWLVRPKKKNADS